MSELLHNVKAIFSQDAGFLVDHEKSYYNIPFYQRGYKWTTKQVKKLLEDIDRFVPTTGKFYCVQNITVVPKSDFFNVVDGQQRLTTMTIILSCLGRKDLVRRKVKFPKNSIREKTNEFIDKFITDGQELYQGEYKNWEKLISDHPDYDHQDIYFIHQAAIAVFDWFVDREDKQEFVEKLLHHVKFITNYIEGDNEERIFGNLNSKRIYLDGADLVRAILITRVTNEESRRENDLKSIVRINERRVRIGWQLDEINQWWSDPNVREYFDPWLAIKWSGDIVFNKDKYPINRLLTLLAESEGHDALTLEFIENYENALELYKKLNRLHETLKDWYYDKELYHYLGFLFAQKSNRSEFSFNEVWDTWINNSDSRKAFKLHLLGLIKQEIFGKSTLNELFKSDKNWYGGDNKTLVQILLMLDIIEGNKEYKDKLRSHAFSKKGNDIEHIFPQKPQGFEKKEEIEGFINFLVKYDEELKDHEILDRFESEYDDPLYQEELNEFLDEYIEDIPIHSIGNLVLLYDSLNRSIRNNPYAYKRKRILDFFNKGNYIQPHTLKVFARYFQDGSSNGFDLEHWTREDIASNEEHIKKTLYNYFKVLDQDEN
ncbi:DUF262 domain-containing protein [Christiangramia sp.]|uniref:DUF262 domain-containing protein n=1 Tax=Christiangramia sp. TaxID=1931228 RepID=UPI0026228CFA|nr:DUF262 domain-containing protein [Christiangramia sp.]